MKAKWAQLSPVDRAYEKLPSDRGRFSCLIPRDRRYETKKDKRERNRYYQLLKHWCELKKKTETMNSLKES